MTKRAKDKSTPHPPQTEDNIIDETPSTAPQPQLTLETSLYVIIAVVGVALRLWNLDNYPLSDAEAQHGLVAFHLFNGGELASTSYSPLLVTLDGLIFLLFQATDSTARLATVLLGSALILIPATLRKQLGSSICLLASALLALSPTAIFLSRTLNSEIAVAGGALLIVSGFFNWAADGQRRSLFMLAAGIALLLTAGPMAYSIILIFAIIVLLRLSEFKFYWYQGLEYSTKRQEIQNNAQADDDQSVSINPDLQQAGIFLLVAFVLFSTAATFNLSGFGLATGLFADWVSRIGFQPQPNAGFNAVFLLTIYEPLLLFAGLIGLAYAFLTRNLLRLVIASWALGILIIDLVMAGRPTGSVILAVVPLAFLAAFALADLWQGLQRWGSWGNEGVIFAASLVFFIFGYIGLVGWLDRTCASEDTFCQLAWLQVVAALSVFVVVVAFFWVINGAGPALRGAALTGVVFGILVMVNIGWRLNYGPLMNLGYQPLAGVPASTELVTLSDTLASESTVRVGDENLLDITLVGLQRPSLLWQLKTYSKLDQSNSLIVGPTTSAVITPTPNDGDNNFGLTNHYVGQDFAVDAVWSPVGMQPKDLFSWLIYREASQRPSGSKIVLWLRLN